MPHVPSSSASSIAPILIPWHNTSPAPSCSRSSSLNASPAAWFSPALGSPGSSDAKGKGRALDAEEPRNLLRRAASTRSFDRSKQINPDLEGGTPNLHGLGLEGLESGETAESKVVSQVPTRPRAPSYVLSNSWRPSLGTSFDNPLSRLTRRRVSPGSPLPLTAPLPSRSASTESSASDFSLASSSSPLGKATASLRLQRASRPHRSKRKRGTFESTAWWTCACLFIVIIVLLVSTRSGRQHPQRWRFLDTGGLLDLSLRPPRAAHSPPVLDGRPSRSWRQQTSNLAPQRDTLILYRILGNDLPPRHTHGQTLRNVRFMLEHEHSFSDLPPPMIRVEKYYVLNRIASQETIESLLAIFDDFGVPASHVLNLPFEWDEYSKQSFRWSGGVADNPGIWKLERPDYDHPSPFASSNSSDLSTEANWSHAQTMGRLRAIDFTFHDKNQYAINNNGGRNFALAHGRSLAHARWILPLDGNCFFTPSAMLSMVSTLSAYGDEADSPRYVVIPMSRLLDNEAVLPTNFEIDEQVQPALPPQAPEEPQIGFRFDAAQSYQQVMRYGRRSKLEMLWRLGAVPKSRDLHNRMLPWETNDRQILTADSYGSVRGKRGKAAFLLGGWVFRLFSGDPRQEHFSAQANLLRNMNRIKGIVAFLERLDEVLVRGKLCPTADGTCGFSKDHFWSFNTTRLSALTSARLAGQTYAIHRVAPLIRLAQQAKHSLEDHVAQGTIETADAVEASQNATAMALVGHLTGNGTLTLSAATLIRLRFFAQEPAKADPSDRESDGAGYTFPLPATMYDQALWLHAPKPTSQWPVNFDATQLLDALRLLSHVHLPRTMRKAVRDILPAEDAHAAISAHLSRLLFDGRRSESLEDGASFDTQVAALASAADDARLLSRIASRAPLRLKRGERPTSTHCWLLQGLRLVQFTDKDVETDGRHLCEGPSRSLIDTWGPAFAELEL